MQEAKPAEAVYHDEAAGSERKCLVLNSNVLISGRRYMAIRVEGEEKTVPAAQVTILEQKN